MRIEHYDADTHDLVRRDAYSQALVNALLAARAHAAELAEVRRIVTETLPDLADQPDRETTVRRVTALATRYQYQRDAAALLRKDADRWEATSQAQAIEEHKLRAKVEALQAGSRALALDLSEIAKTVGETGDLVEPPDVIDAVRLVVTQRDALNSDLTKLVTERDALKAEVEKLHAEADELRRRIHDALSARTKEGMLASEWIARTGQAEREAREARAELEREKKLSSTLYYAKAKAVDALNEARAEKEKAEFSARQFCCAHIGKKFLACPACELKELRAEADLRASPPTHFHGDIVRPDWIDAPFTAAEHIPVLMAGAAEHLRAYAVSQERIVREQHEEIEKWRGEVERLRSAPAVCAVDVKATARSVSRIIEGGDEGNFEGTVMACERCAVALVERQHALQALRGKYAGVLPSVDEYVEEKRAEAPAPKPERVKITGDPDALIEARVAPAPQPEPAPAREWTEEQRQRNAARIVVEHVLFALPGFDPHDDDAGLVDTVLADSRVFAALQNQATRFVRVKLPGWRHEMYSCKDMGEVQQMMRNDCIAALRAQGVEVDDE